VGVERSLEKAADTLFHILIWWQRRAAFRKIKLVSFYSTLLRPDSLMLSHSLTFGRRLETGSISIKYETPKYTTREVRCDR
jgi:hypothetical protein